MLKDYIQLRIYLDYTITLDMYDDVSDVGYIEKVAKSHHNFMQKMPYELPPNLTIRATPYLMTVCQNCGQVILTNREIYSQFTCINCKTTQTVVLMPQYNDIVNDFENAATITKKELFHHMLYLVFAKVPHGSDDVLAEILNSFGYMKFDEMNYVYRESLMELYNRGILDKSIDRLPIMFSKESDNDIEYNGNIRSIQNVVSVVRHKISADIFSLSAALDMQSDGYQYMGRKISDEMEFVDKAIEQNMSSDDEISIELYLLKANHLIMQKKYAEAKKILDFVLLKDRNNAYALRTYALLRENEW